jgi:transcriptional regulator with XRE-family HTH domain
VKRTNQGALALSPHVAERGKKTELAGVLGIDQPTMTRIIQGRPPAAGVRLKLQELFGIDWRVWDEKVEVDGDPDDDDEPADTERAPA